MSSLSGSHSPLLRFPPSQGHHLVLHSKCSASPVSALPLYQSSTSSEQKLHARRALFFSLAGFMSNPFHASCTPAFDQGSQEPIFTAHKSEAMEQKTMQNLSAMLSTSPLMDINSVDTLRNNEEGIKGSFHNLLLFYLNTFGYLASGVLGGLFWFECEMRTSSETILQDSKSKLKAKEHALHALRQRLESESFRDDRKTQLELDSSTEAKNTCSELKYSMQYSNDLRVKLQAKRIKVQDLLKQIKVFEVAIQETEKKKAQHKQNLIQVCAKKENLEAKFNRLRLDVVEKEAQVNELSLSCEQKEQVISKLLLKLSDEKASLASRIEEIEQDFIEEHKLSKSESDMKVVREMMKTAIKTGVEVDKDVIAVSRDSDFLTLSFVKKLQSIHEDIKCKEGEYKVLAEDLAMTLRNTGERKEIITNLQEKVDSLKKKTQEINAAIMNVNDKLILYSQSANTAKEEINCLSCDLEDMRSVNERLKKQSSELQLKREAQLASLRHALHQEQGFSPMLKEEILKVSENLSKSTSSISLLAEKAASCEDSYNQLKRKVSESAHCAMSTCITLEKEREIATARKKELSLARQKMSEAKKNITFLQSDLEELKSEREDLIKDINDLTEKLEIANERDPVFLAERCADINENKESSLKNEVTDLDEALSIGSIEAECKQRKENPDSIIRELSQQMLVMDSANTSKVNASNKRRNARKG